MGFGSLRLRVFCVYPSVFREFYATHEELKMLRHSLPSVRKAYSESDSVHLK
jgi:hypothetical protein